MQELTYEEAEAVYDILVEVCHAPIDARTAFVIYHTTKPWMWPTEWRFQGNLGFGGKFWNDYKSWSVNCYSDDMTDERGGIIYNANMQLAALREQSRGV